MKIKHILRITAAMLLTTQIHASDPWAELNESCDINQAINYLCKGEDARFPNRQGDRWDTRCEEFAEYLKESCTHAHNYGYKNCPGHAAYNIADYISNVPKPLFKEYWNVKITRAGKVDVPSTYSGPMVDIYVHYNYDKNCVAGLPRTSLQSDALTDCRGYGS